MLITNQLKALLQHELGTLQSISGNFVFLYAGKVKQWTSQFAKAACQVGHGEERFALAEPCTFTCPALSINALQRRLE
jgi:hypothetical protein